MCPSSFSKAARFASRKTPWHVGRCVTEMARLYESTEYSQLRPCPCQQESCWSLFVCQFATTQVPYEDVFHKTMSLFSFGVFQKGDVQLGHTGPLPHHGKSKVRGSELQHSVVLCTVFLFARFSLQQAAMHEAIP